MGQFSITWVYLLCLEALIYSAAFVFSTFLLGPDLDLYYSKINKNWGVLRFIWWPYARLSKHRGLSHTPFLSSVIRLGYAHCLRFHLYLVVCLSGRIGELPATNKARLKALRQSISGLMSMNFPFVLKWKL